MITLTLTDDQAIVLWDALADARNIASDLNDKPTEIELTYMMSLVDAATGNDK
jgi:hypothetical protein